MFKKILTTSYLVFVLFSNLNTVIGTPACYIKNSRPGNFVLFEKNEPVIRYGIKIDEVCEFQDGTIRLRYVTFIHM